MQNRRIEISERSIVFAILFPLGLWLLWIVKELLFSLLIAFILMTALKPVSEWLHKKGMPRIPSVFTVFILFLAIFVSLVSLIVPPIVTETTAFVRTFPEIVADLPPQMQQFVDINTLSQFVPDVTNNFFSVVTNLFSNFIFIVSTLFFTIYFMIEKNLVAKVLSPIRNKERHEHYVNIVHQVERQLTAWFWGQITLMTVVGVVTYIGLLLIGVRYPLPLAVLAGLLEVVPNLGPVMASIPALIVASSESWLFGVVVLVLYFVIQQLENVLIVPYIMKRAVNVSPILTLIALFVGGKIGGILGVLLSIPLLIITQTIIHELFAARRAKEHATHSSS